MRVALLSSTEFGYKCLKEAILKVPAVKLCGVLTTKDRIRISYSNESVFIVSHHDFVESQRSSDYEVLVAVDEKMDESMYDVFLNRCRPDLVLVLGWYYMIPKKARKMPKFGTLGIHASLLPKYRGGAPIPWAIINGETKTGVTLFSIEDGVDNGDIVAQESFSIEEYDDCRTVYNKATKASLEILREYLPKITGEKVRYTKQREDEASYFPQRSPEDGEIDWSDSTKSIYNFVRAQTRPYPGAFSFIGGRKVMIWSVRKASKLVTRRMPPGRVLKIEGQPAVSTQDGYLLLGEHEFQSADGFSVLGDGMCFRSQGKCQR